MLTVLDEHTRECLAIVVARKIRSHDVLEVLADLFVRHGPPEYLRSDNGPEFTAKLVRRWLGLTRRRLVSGAANPCCSRPFVLYIRSDPQRIGDRLTEA